MGRRRGVVSGEGGMVRMELNKLVESDVEWVDGLGLSLCH